MTLRPMTVCRKKLNGHELTHKNFNLPYHHQPLIKGQVTLFEQSKLHQIFIDLKNHVVVLNTGLLEEKRNQSIGNIQDYFIALSFQIKCLISSFSNKHSSYY